MKNVSDFNDTSVQNGMFQNCILMENTYTSSGFIFTCSEFQNPWFGILTLTCIYLPSAQVVSSLYGPQLGGWLGTLFGLCVMVPIGCIIVSIVAPVYNSAEWFVFGYFLVLLGTGTGFIGAKIYKMSLPRQNCSMDNGYKVLLYPFSMAFSPIIFIIMKFLPIVRNSKLIQNIVKFATESETLYESAPQLTLQLYILLSKLNPDGWAWYSITTSSLSLLVSLVSQYIENLPENSWKDYVKSIIVILPNMIFKILSIRYLYYIKS